MDGWRRLKCTTAIFVKYCIFWDAKFHLKTTFLTLTKTFTVGYLPFPLASSIQIKLCNSKNILGNILENSRLDMGIIFGTQFIKTHMKRNEKIRKQWHKIRSKKPSFASCMWYLRTPCNFCIKISWRLPNLGRYFISGWNFIETGKIMYFLQIQFPFCILQPRKSYLANLMKLPSYPILLSEVPLDPSVAGG